MAKKKKKIHDKTCIPHPILPEHFGVNAYQKQVFSVLIMAKCYLHNKDIKGGPTYPHIQRAQLSPTCEILVPCGEQYPQRNASPASLTMSLFLGT